MKYLYELIKSHSQWLGQRLMYHANKDSYVKYYNADETSWIIPLKALSEHILKILEENEYCYVTEFDEQAIYNSVSAIGVGNIIRCYKEKIDIGIYIGTIKCYRKCYRDLVAESFLGDIEKSTAFCFIESFFDKVEIVSCVDWSKRSESEIRFNALANITSAFIFIYDGEKYVYVNKAAENFTGYTREEITNMKFHEIYHPDCEEKLKELEFDLSKREHYNLNTYELKILTKQGEEKWIEFNAGIIYFSDEPAMLGIAFSIENKKKAEEKLKRSEERYRRLVELMPDAIFVHADNKIHYTNAAGAKMLGLVSPQEVIGQDAAKFIEIDPKQRIFNDEYLEYMIREGTLPLVEQKFIRKVDNKLVEIETTAALIPYGNGLAILDISRDVSERKRVEELNEKVKEKTRLLEETVQYDKLKTEFFANVSHELRTPLNVILGALQLIELIEKNNKIYESKEKISKYKDIMKQNCFRLIRLVNNLIDITKIDADYFELSLKNTNIVSVVEDITLSVVDYVESKGITITFDTEIEEKTISCDPDKIERILLNLLSNAVKFTEAGGSINVCLYDGLDNVSISVKDTGIGIPKDKQKLIFERFIQVDKSLSRNREGSGIGLSLVKSLVEMHGGTIILISEPGVGSEFIVQLPAQILDSPYISRENATYFEESKIERTVIEFSDIYS